MGKAFLSHGQFWSPWQYPGSGTDLAGARGPHLLGIAVLTLGSYFPSVNLGLCGLYHTENNTALENE